jgi:hypothetical protein
VNHQTPADPGWVRVGDRGLVAIQALDMKLVLDAAEGIGPWARDALAHAGLTCALVKENVEALRSVDDDQLPALRRLRAAFRPIEVVEVVRHARVISHDPEGHRGRGHREAWPGGEDGGPAADDP